MNERIKQLMEQAKYEEAVFGGGFGGPNMVKKLDPIKFAESIVRECGQVLVDNTPVVDLIEDWDKGYDRAMNDCIHHIYEHFGVEE